MGFSPDPTNLLLEKVNHHFFLYKRVNKITLRSNRISLNTIKISHNMPKICLNCLPSKIIVCKYPFEKSF